MSAADRSLELARLLVRLDDARTTARTLLGDKYDATVARARATLRSIAAKRGESVLSVATRAAKGATENGAPGTVLVLLAAALDEIEATP